MALYLGNSGKLKVQTLSGVCHFIVSSVSSILSKITLKSSDNYILKDSNGVYLTAKEDE